MRLRIFHCCRRHHHHHHQQQQQQPRHLICAGGLELDFALP